MSFLPKSGHVRKAYTWCGLQLVLTSIYLVKNEVVNFEKYM